MSNSSIQTVRYYHINEIIPIEKESYNSPWAEEYFNNDIRNKCSLNYIYFKNN